jgi:hypothetical protein
MPPGDRDITRREADLPGLAHLLDVDTFASAVAAASGIAIDGAELTYLRYKPRTNCIATYRLTVGGDDAFVYAKAHHRGDTDKYAKARARLGTEPSALGVPGVALDSIMTVVHGFPNDQLLAPLGKLFAGDRRRERFLTRIAPTHPDLWTGVPSTLRYKAERRFVARLEVDGVPQAVLKIVGQHDYADAARGLRAIAEHAPIPVPTPLGRSRSSGALLSSWIDGTPLDEAGAARPSATRVAGATLARLHGAPAPGLRRRDREGDAVALVAMARSVSFLLPALERRLVPLALEVASALLEGPDGGATLHGDCSSDQVVTRGDDVAMIDFDRACLGPAAVDLGTFVARLRCDALVGRLTVNEVGALETALLAGYGEPPPCLERHVAAGLLRLAPHPFRERHPAWPEITERIVDAAAAAAGRGQSAPHTVPTTGAPDR